MARSRIKRIHVNRQNIASNLKHGTNKPTLTCKVGKENLKGFVIQIHGPSTLLDAGACGLRPLSCGARIWIETNAAVRIDGKMIE